MKRPFLRAAMAFAGLALAMPLLAQQPVVSAVSDSDGAAIRAALDRGVLIYAYDQAAWHSTDDMVARLRAAGTLQATGASVAGWVVTGSADAPVITYYDRTTPRARAIYRATMAPWGRSIVSATLWEAGAGPLVSDEEAAAIADFGRAASAFGAANPTMCAKARPNTVTLPVDAQGVRRVYFLTPQTAARTVPAGGHWRVELRGEAAPAVRAFSKSCIDLSLPGSGDKQADAFGVTHLLDPVPTEIHVFTMLALQKPLYVATVTPQRTWAIEVSGGQARMRLVDDAASNKALNRR